MTTNDTRPTTAGAATPARSVLIERDLDAIEALLDQWITDAGGVDIPLLGTPDWVDADERMQRAGVAVFVLGCLVEREPLVLAARLAAEVATVRSIRLVAARQASHAISAGADWSAVAQRLVQRDRIARHDRLRR
ncbi:MAG: hypothetical protein J0I34_22590 [Pseudonocardia sp.]|uniref:hypothetical protein n=1 Tax=unclassified Pseudonocardia TaxID=2619320 RepID=UPI00086B859A|nr:MULTISPECIES: hypothetical protein [unclassified Pseudonocardia]MBN9111559.1 hypothetical protein [Pseudonocardia sp.]ODU99158.1 MAG: hypothetical protein ABT15_32355 [Pseudonocardia sp. SCN 73-27]